MDMYIYSAEYQQHSMYKAQWRKIINIQNFMIIRTISSRKGVTSGVGEQATTLEVTACEETGMDELSDEDICDEPDVLRDDDGSGDGVVEVHVVLSDADGVGDGVVEVHVV